MMTKRHLAIIAACSLLLSGCAGPGEPATPTRPIGQDAGDSRPPVSGSAGGSDVRAVPLDTVSDWLSWSDVAVVGTVTGDGLAPAQPDDPGLAGRQTLLRDVDVTVDEVVWTFPGTTPPLAASDSITITEPTWLLDNGTRTVLRTPGAEHLDVGQTYLLFLTASGTFPWTTIAPESQLRVTAGDVSTSLPGGAPLDTRSGGDLRRTLAATSLHPDIAELHDIPYRDRVGALMDARKRPS